MRRLVLNLGVSLAGLAAAVFAVMQGQRAMAACFVVLALLRAAATLVAARPRKLEPPIRLHLDDTDDSGEGMGRR